MKHFWIVLFLSAFLFCGCGSGGGERYTDSLSPRILAERCASSIGLSGMEAENADRIRDYAALPSDADLTVLCAADRGNLDEVGVWRADNPEDARTLLETYLKNSYQDNRSYYDSYIPAQTSKLRDAEVRTFGNYVVYAILDDRSRADFFKEIRAELLMK